VDIRTVSLAFVLLGTGSFAAGCSEAGPSEEGPPVPLWSLGEPAISIGVVGGDERYQFQDIASAWRDAGGRLVVLDRSPRAVRIFGPDGTHLHAFGARGQGPGEIAMPWAGFPYPGDSVAVLDLGNRRISIFDGDGRYGRSVPVPMQFPRRPGTIPSQSCCQVTGVLPDGSFLVHPPDEIPVEAGPPRHSTFTLLRMTRDGSTVDTLGTFPSSRYSYDASAPNNVRHFLASVPFLYTPLGSSVVGGNAESSELVKWTPGEDSLATFRIAMEPEPFTPQVREAMEAAYRAERERRPERFGEQPIETYIAGESPESVPLFTRLLADGNDRLWARQWHPPLSRDPVVWNIFDRDGAHVARLELPGGSRLMWVGTDEAVLVVRDDLDVERIRVVPIHEG
jgi:hypothetical protein